MAELTCVSFTHVIIISEMRGGEPWVLCMTSCQTLFLYHYTLTHRYYSSSIFSRIGVEHYISTAIVGIINFLTTIMSIFLVDKVLQLPYNQPPNLISLSSSLPQIGRKALLLLGSTGMFFSMLLAATFIVAFRVGLEGEDEETSRAVGYVIVLLVCFFVFNFAYSWG